MVWRKREEEARTTQEKGEKEGKEEENCNRRTVKQWKNEGNKRKNQREGRRRK